MKLKARLTILLAMCLAASLIRCGGSTESGGRATTAKADSSGRCPHDIKQDKCPFCSPQLVESEGFCGEHGVAEALCCQCRPYLKAAFRAKGDWCAEHGAPESQCAICNPELKEKLRPGEHSTRTTGASGALPAAPGNCPHGVVEARCPFCTPGLIESDGFCREHNVAEALCVQCRPYLKTAFIAKGDWCAEHNTPESQCALCNPELNDGGNR